MRQGSWSVEYTDGTTISQYDRTHPRFHESGEVPYRAIEFDRAKSISFESQFLGERHTFELTHHAGYRVTLHSRTFMGVNAGQDAGVRCFILATTPEGGDPFKDAVAVFFWFPDGATHHTFDYNSPEANAYGAALVHGQITQLPKLSDAVSTRIDATVA